MDIIFDAIIFCRVEEALVNVLEKSIMLTSYCCPSVSLFTGSSVKFIICVLQDLLVLKPCWLSVRSLFFEVVHDLLKQ